MDIDQGKVLTIRGPIQEMKTIHALVDKTVERFGRIDVLVIRRDEYEQHLRSTTLA